jgi:hypothetical protein
MLLQVLGLSPQAGYLVCYKRRVAVKCDKNKYHVAICFWSTSRVYVALQTQSAQRRTQALACTSCFVALDGHLRLRPN